MTPLNLIIYTTGGVWLMLGSLARIVLLLAKDQPLDPLPFVGLSVGLLMLVNLFFVGRKLELVPRPEPGTVPVVFLPQSVMQGEHGATQATARE